MQTECSAKPSAFGQVEGRPVVAEFDGGALTSDAGGLLLGAADRRLDMVRRLARCFRDARDPRLVEQSVATLVGQRVFGIALGYEDLNDHDELRHDPLMAALAGKLKAWRSGNHASDLDHWGLRVGPSGQNPNATRSGQQVR